MTNDNHHDHSHKKLHPILEALLKGVAEALTRYFLEHGADLATWIHHLLM